MDSIEGLGIGYEIIVSNDREGRGKGWALREALKEAQGERIAFLDSDGEIQPKMLLRLLPFLDDYDAVVGSKSIAGGMLARRIVTFFSRIYIRLFFGLPFDTQTGIKLFRRKVIPDWKTDGFLFDVEILSKIKKAGGRIIEVPIEATITKSLSWKTLWNTLMESLRLKFQS